MSTTIIVTRHPGALEWLRKHHPEFAGATHITHASPGDLRGNIVIGVLPIPLAALCKEYHHLDMLVPPEFRGKELTVEDMETFGCFIKQYVVEAGK